jgi:hypothetical protein
MGSMETRQAGSRDPRLEHKKGDWGHNSGRAVEFGREEARQRSSLRRNTRHSHEKSESRNRETCTLAENLLFTHLPVAQPEIYVICVCVGIAAIERVPID